MGDVRRNKPIYRPMRRDKEMSAKKATKAYHISASDAKAAEKADKAIREMLERIGVKVVAALG